MHFDTTTNIKIIDSFSVTQITVDCQIQRIIFHVHYKRIFLFQYWGQIMKYGHQWITIKNNDNVSDTNTFFFLLNIFLEVFLYNNISKVWKTFAWQLDEITATCFMFLCCRVLHTLSCCQSPITRPVSAAGDADGGRRLCTNTGVCERKQRARTLQGAYHGRGQCHFLFNKSQWWISVWIPWQKGSIMKLLTTNATGK